MPRRVKSAATSIGPLQPIGRTARIVRALRLTTQQIDWLNLAFMIGSAAAAYVLPFEVFLFAYAVLGPLHYLTEISWLHQRNYFTSGRGDYLWLLVIGFALFVTGFLVPWQQIAEGSRWNMFMAAALPYLAFIAALAMVVCQKPVTKLLCVGGGLVLFFAMINWPAYTLIFGVFLPTLVHVYVFTGLFMLYGTLKSRSGPGICTGRLSLLARSCSCSGGRKPDTSSAIMAGRLMRTSNC